MTWHGRRRDDGRPHGDCRLHITANSTDDLDLEDAFVSLTYAAPEAADV